MERDGNPVCHIWWPEPLSDAWMGVWGGAKIHYGQPEAQTADGVKHSL